MKNMHLPKTPTNLLYELHLKMDYETVLAIEKLKKADRMPSKSAAIRKTLIEAAAKK